MNDQPSLASGIAIAAILIGLGLIVGFALGRLT